MEKLCINKVILSYIILEPVRRLLPHFSSNLWKIRVFFVWFCRRTLYQGKMKSKTDTRSRTQVLLTRFGVFYFHFFPIFSQVHCL